MKRVIACVLLAGCTFGGSDEDPRVPIAPIGSVEGVLDASMGAETPSKPSKPSVPEANDAGSMPMPVADASRPQLDSGGGNACEPSEPVAACDPIRNTGCPPFTQCDIEPGASTPMGRCVFFQAALDPSTCVATVVNTTCTAQTTCVANACRKLCYCDSDCEAGERCDDTSGPGPKGAFKLCRAQ